MKKRIVDGIIKWVAAVLLGLIAQCVTAAKPNVVLIYIDDLGYGDVGAYGCKDIPTPHIDRLAKEGVLCTAAYITNPPCSPSRSSLMMGQYGQRFGKYGMSRGLPIPEDRPTLAEFMRDQGYVTGQMGKWDIGSDVQTPSTCGFTEVANNPPRKIYTDEELPSLEPVGLQAHLKRKEMTSKYILIDEQGEEQWLTEYDGDQLVDFIGRNKDKPFFLYWSPEAVHSSNLETPERLMSRTTAEGARRKLAGAIVAVDDQVGKIIEALEQQGLREDTLVIFASDNGPNLGEKGSAAPYAGGKGNGTQQEGWVRVPVIFSYPGTLPEGSVYDGLMANFDFYSTMAALNGKPIPEHCDGVNLLPYLKGEKQGDAHEYLYWLNKDPTDPDHRNLVVARWKNWRLYKHKEADEWKLFDLVRDPQETTDVSAAHPEIVTAMAEKHEAWKKTLAPLVTVPELPEKPKVPVGYGWSGVEEIK